MDRTDSKEQISKGIVEIFEDRLRILPSFIPLQRHINGSRLWFSLAPTPLEIYAGINYQK